MNGILAEHLARLAEQYPESTVHQVPGGSTIVRVPNIKLPAGWSKRETAISFILAPAYPFAAPDCFWADNELRLASNAQPQGSQANHPIPEDGHGLWFSWHLSQPWNPNRDDLVTWMAVIKQRFAKSV